MNTISTDATVKRGVLIGNLGSPKSPSVADVKVYLREFLMDPGVIRLPWLLRALLVNGFIIPFRVKRVANDYKAIWTGSEAPLVEVTRSLTQQVSKGLSIPVSFGMRYGRPNLEDGVRELLAAQADLTEILFLPQFPQYAEATTGSIVDELRRVMQAVAPAVALRVMDSFFDRPDYIHSVVQVASPFLKTDYDHILFSYHSLPESYLRKTDPTNLHCLKTQDCCTVSCPDIVMKVCYRAQCIRTTQAIVEQAGIPKEKYSIAYQSQLGKHWMKPYTDETIQAFAGAGMKRLLVICPSFTVDCLETTDEIHNREGSKYPKLGGGEMIQIPCLNDDSGWAKTLQSWAVENS